MNDYVQRDRAGEHEDVWRELTALADWVILPAWREAAETVAAEAMQRAAHAIDELIPRLRAAGYRFGELAGGRRPDNWLATKPLRTPPDEKVRERLVMLETAVGPLPLALRASFEYVGGVNLIGHHPDWPATEELDPLYLPPLDDEHLAWLLEEAELWKNDPQYPTYGQRFELPLAPDRFHKAHLSAGPSYVIRTGIFCMDDVFICEPNRTTFGNYLRLALRRGGMPGIREPLLKLPRSVAHAM